MNVFEAAEKACQEPTLIKALVWMAVWDNTRAVEQALECERTGVSTAVPGCKWDTTFERCFEEVYKRWKGPVVVPRESRELQLYADDGSHNFTVTITPMTLTVTPKP